MMCDHPIEVILVFDIGKTNKKRILFDKHLAIVDFYSTALPEIEDEDGFPCENVDALVAFVLNGIEEVFSNPLCQVRGVNFSAYGASLVYVDKEGKPVLPLYNYLKPYPTEIQNEFYAKYGGELNFSRSAASPVLGSLNSGMQLYKLKYTAPQMLEQVDQIVHLPQFLSFMVTGNYFTDLTSIGCHTNLWNFDSNNYQQWLADEQLQQFFPPITYTGIAGYKLIQGSSVLIGTGLHDSSAALIPHLKQRKNKFLLLSTGTWCISLHPFNHHALSETQLQNDCLCYLLPDGSPIKASRFFGGHIHDEMIYKIASRFQTTTELILAHRYSNDDLDDFYTRNKYDTIDDCNDAWSAYLMFMFQLLVEQKKAIDWLITEEPVDEIVVEGGFSSNTLFLLLLQRHYPTHVISVANLPQGSALGAAMMLKYEIWKN